MFTFTVSEAQNPSLHVGDVGWNGERFEVSNHGIYTGFWTANPGESGQSWTPFSSPNVVGSWDLEAGSYALTFRLQQWWVPGYDIPPFTWLGAFKIDVDPIPIPGAIWLLGSGLIGIVGIRKRFKK